MQRIFLAGLVLAHLAGPALADDRPFVPLDHGRIPRRIVREPVHVAGPPYALFVFGPAGKARMWAVLDKIRPAPVKLGAIRSRDERESTNRARLGFHTRCRANLSRCRRVSVEAREARWFFDTTPVAGTE